MISLTLQFTDLAAAAHALAQMAGIQTGTPAAPAGLTPSYQLAVDAGRATATATPAGTVIEYHDRPDVGAPTPQPALPDPAAAAFGGAVAQAAPLVTPAAPTAQPASMQPSAATGPTVAPAVERDSTGLIWDSRIHASTKTKTKEGVWTAKRNVDEAFRAQVVADLRGLPAPNPLAGMPAPTTGAALPPAAPPPALTAGAPEAPTFPSYMAQIGAVFSARPLDAHAHMTTALAQHGLQGVGQLAGRPDLIPAVDAEFRRLLG